MDKRPKHGRGRPPGTTRAVAVGYDAAVYVADAVERGEPQKNAVQDAAEKFKVSRRTIYRWLPYERLMRRPHPPWAKVPPWPHGQDG